MGGKVAYRVVGPIQEKGLVATGIALDEIDGALVGLLLEKTPLESVKPRYRPLFFLFLPIQIGNAVLPGILLFLLVRGLFNTIGYSGGTIVTCCRSARFSRAN